MEILKDYIAQFELNHPDNVVKIYFSRKSSSNTSKYITHNPTTSTEVQNGIIKTVLPYIKNQLDIHTIVNYNPLGVLETIKTTEIPSY